MNFAMNRPSPCRQLPAIRSNRPLGAPRPFSTFRLLGAPRPLSTFRPLGASRLLRYLLSACALLAIAVEAAAQATEPIPTRAETGADALPPQIAPIEAPFYMPQLGKPAIRDTVVRLEPLPRGASCTASIQTAIDRLSAAGGGRVQLAAGCWNTGRILLKSGIELHLEEGAELHFSGETADYLPVVHTTNEGVELLSLGACIYACGAHDIALTGRGRLIGPADGEVRRAVSQNEVPIDPDMPLAERIFDGREGSPAMLPTFFGPVDCRNVYLEGVTFERTAFWNVAPVYCQQVVIRGIRVNSFGIPRGDGIDLTCCRYVLVEYVTTDCGDDNIAVKGGRDEHGYRRDRASEHIVIRRCLALRGMGGLTVGTETAGWVRNLYVHDCVCDGTRVGIRLKTRRTRGGGGENLYFERIRLSTEAGAMAWEMLGTAPRLPVPALTHLTPSFRNVSIRQVIVDGCRELIHVQGLPENPARNIRIEQVTADTRRDTTRSAYGRYKPKPSPWVIDLADADGITLRDLRIVSSREGIRLLDVRDALFERVHFDFGESGPQLVVAGDATRDLRFVACTPQLTP